jgi:hypothetical protein
METPLSAVVPAMLLAARTGLSAFFIAGGIYTIRVASKHIPKLFSRGDGQLSGEFGDKVWKVVSRGSGAILMGTSICWCVAAVVAAPRSVTVSAGEIVVSGLFDGPPAASAVSGIELATAERPQDWAGFSARAPNAPPPGPLIGFSPEEVYRLHPEFDVFGLFDVNDKDHCSPHAAARHLLPLGMVLTRNDEVVLTAESVRYKIGEFTASVIAVLEPAMALLKLAGDPVVERRHICVAMFKSAEPAISLQAGYIAVNPGTIGTLVQGLSDPQTGLNFIYTHEFMHHLLYWGTNPFRGEATARRTELLADCGAAAIMGMRLKGAVSSSRALAAIRSAAINSGDFELLRAKHHGSPAERPWVVDAGLKFALTATLTPKSEQIVDHCAKVIAAQDQRYGDLWPITILGEAQ